MNRKEQSQQMKENILQLAIKEFSTHDYQSASLNHIKEDGQISKGIIYHYFKDKDELYCCCASQCFHNLLAYIQAQENTYTNIKDAIFSYLDQRRSFFAQYPEYRGLYFNLLYRTPEHLKENIVMYKREFDEHNIAFLSSLLKDASLNPAITLEEAIEFLMIQIECFHEHFQNEVQIQGDISTIELQYDQKVKGWLELIMYGILKEEIQ